MTDKEQIICHGVDVSKCDRLNLNSVYGWDDPAMCSIPCCKNAPNCLFKQLTRKTQECEQKDERIIELTKGNKESQKWIKEWNKYVGLVRSWITQAAKDLGLDTEHSFGVEHFTFAVRCLKEENKKLKQECEELKKEYEKQKNTWLKQSKVIFLKKKSIEALKKAVLLKENNRYIQSCLTQEKQLEYEKLLNKLTRGVVLPAIPEPEVINLADRYRKALEEIEGVVKEMHSICIEEISITASQLNDRIYRESCERFKQILDIINKAKGEE